MAKRKAVGFLTTEMGLSERRSCRTVSFARSVQQYRPVERDAAAVLKRMRTLASENRRYGYPRQHVMLCGARGWSLNHKRTWRLYRAESLQVRTKKRRKPPRRDRVAPLSMALAKPATLAEQNPASWIEGDRLARPSALARALSP